ncbi:hypothetical protein OG462_40270 [Streptomyces sp. NBC_01077]|uniref:hypothetical protein n=1 Tax=Streptomyces sp. NBC_01077 TaxID=2903746 RepID=UPI00386A8684|nr:hypothetical protein OG462_40270 [Streptomyces sp. NBC_01077]
MNDDDYSATELGSHWFEHPTPHAAPDRVEGEVLRFGPGVTAATARRAENTPTAVQIWHGTLPGVPAPRPTRSRRPRRYALAGVVLAAVLAFLAWQHYGPRVAVRDVTVTTPAQQLGCDGTADVVGVVRTDGRPGTVTYRWERSDGTRSGALHERLTRGQKEARVHLLWTFHGPGTHQAVARLVIAAPAGHTSSATFTYHCDRGNQAG